MDAAGRRGNFERINYPSCLEIDSRGAFNVHETDVAVCGVVRKNS